MPKVVLGSGVKIHYQQIGEGPDLVMIHGLTGNLAVWHLKIVPTLCGPLPDADLRPARPRLQRHAARRATRPTDMAADLLELLDALEIERPAIVGHSYGADIALYFAYHYPDRVSEVVAIEAALPAMIHLRNREDWEGWDYWADVLERSGLDGAARAAHRRRTTCSASSLSMPKKWGPLNGLPRNPKPFLRLLDETTVAADYEQVGALTLDRIPIDPDAGAAHVRRAARPSSARTTTSTSTCRTRARSSSRGRSGATSGRSSSPRSSPSTSWTSFAADELGAEGRR